jgi:hypothetical protein
MFSETRELAWRAACEQGERLAEVGATDREAKRSP